MDEHRPLTLAHITHEAIHHLGGIGTVLEGLHCAPAFAAGVERSILVGPLPYPDASVADPLHRLGEFAVRCHYSGPDSHDPEGLSALLRPVEWAFGTPIVYGTRRFHAPGTRETHAEVLLIDVSRPNRERTDAFKWQLFDRYGVDSRPYENSWDYEEYTRLAEPAYHALAALLGARPSRPAVVVAHEFMGLPTALRCAADRRRFRTVFHAHECSTARRLVESLPGHDLAFYPAMSAAMRAGHSIESVFGSQADFARHALVSRSHHLDGVLAVGPQTADELRFLSPEMAAAPVRIAYNGVPAEKLTPQAKRAARGRVDAWLHAVTGRRFDYLITHVTRPVVSKGLWRDGKILAALAPLLAERKKTAAYILLTCGAPIRSFDQASAMASEYRWPDAHREGYPDLDGPETHIWQTLSSLVRNAAGPASPAAVHPIMVNQFGFSRERLGPAAPADLTVADLRRAADAELGPAVYEPFGIAPLEPLHAGAVCLVSTASGCLGLAERAMQAEKLTEADCPILLRADLIGAAPRRDPISLVHMSAHERDEIENQVCRRLAHELARRLPADDAARDRALALGQRLAARMSWDAVAASDFLPAVRAAAATA